MKNFKTFVSLGLGFSLLAGCQTAKLREESVPPRAPSSRDKMVISCGSGFGAVRFELKGEDAALTASLSGRYPKMKTITGKGVAYVDPAEGIYNFRITTGNGFVVEYYMWNGKGVRVLPTHSTSLLDSCRLE